MPSADARPELHGRNRQHARSASDIEHACDPSSGTSCSAFNVKPRRRMVAGAESHRRLNDQLHEGSEAFRAVRALLTSHGGATTMRPTVTACSCACDRAAQSSSSTLSDST